MKKTEIIFAVMALIGLLFACFRLPFGGMLTVFGFFGLACFYMYFSFAFFNNIPLKKIFKTESYTADTSEKRDYRILISVFLGVSLSLLLTGLLFYFMFWPSAFLMMSVGIVSLIPMLIISIIRFSQTKSKFYIRIFIRVAIIGIMALFFRLMPNTTWLEIKYRNHPGYIEAMKNLWEDPNNIELGIELQKEEDKMYGYEYEYKNEE
jgi:hypothetical protein